MNSTPIFRQYGMLNSSSFYLDTLKVIKVNVIIDHTNCIIEGFWFMPVNTFRLEDGKNFSAIALS